MAPAPAHRGEVDRRVDETLWRPPVERDPGVRPHLDTAHAALREVVGDEMRRRMQKIGSDRRLLGLPVGQHDPGPVRQLRPDAGSVTRKSTEPAFSVSITRQLR